VGDGGPEGPLIGNTLALLPTTIGAIARGDGETVAKSMTSEFLISNAIAVSIILSAASYGGLSPAVYAGLSFLNSALTSWSLTMIETEGDVITSINHGMLSGMLSFAGMGAGVLWNMALAEIHAALRPDSWYALTGSGAWAAIDSMLTPATGVTFLGWSKTLVFGLLGGPQIPRDSHDQATDTSKMGLASSASGTKFGYGYEQESTLPTP
jgi:hypothetical protein